MSSESPARRWPNWLLLGLAALVSAWVFWQAQRMIRADYLAMRAQHAVQGWASGATKLPSPQKWDATLQALTAALEIMPESPALQEQLGDLYMVAGRIDWANDALRVKHFTQARLQYEKALALRPTDPQTWASLAGAYMGLGQTGEPMQKAWAKALQLGPNEGHVQPMLLELALANWDTASPELQDWAKTLFDNSPPKQRKAFNAIAERYGLQFDAPVTTEAAETPPETGAERPVPPNVRGASGAP